MFYDILEQENAFLGYKIKKSKKSKKINIFPKGLVEGFGPKLAFFSCFYFRQYRPGKCVLRYSRTKKMPFQALKTRSSKGRKFAGFISERHKWFYAGCD